MAIQITTSSKTGYRDRTIENAAAAELTLAFAIDFTTAGEKLTRNAVSEAKRTYLPIQLDESNIKEWSAAHRAADQIIPVLQQLNTGAGVSINIAGNGMATFSSDIQQSDLDIFMARTLMIAQHKTQGAISRVRSGGQTGIDEAGVKAADALGIPALAHGPADYRLRIRTEHGGHWDVKGQTVFKARLETNHNQRVHLEPLSEINSQLNDLPIDVAIAVLDGDTVNWPDAENYIELAENTEGIDRLWFNDDLFSEHITVKEHETKEHDIYYCFHVKYEEYMSDYISQTDVYSKTLEEAERKVINEKTTHLVTGEYFPDIYEISVKQIIIDGQGYNVDPEDLQEVMDIQEYADNKLKEKPDFINIYHGTGENADLSNFAIRPFEFRTGEDEYEKFQSVEQGFQYMKTLPAFSDMPDQMRSEIQKAILSTTDGAKLREIGHSVPGLFKKEWNIASNKFMRDLIWTSFDSNEVAKERLLSTGNTPFTHIQDKSHWKHAFPGLLKEVRSDFQRRLDIKTEYDKMNTKVNGQTVHFYEGEIEPHKDVIFVFGSNLEGRHGLGAAKVAREKFGAIYGQSEGLQGNAYAIPTKDLRVTENKGYRSVSKEDIIKSIRTMYKSAEENFTKTYMVAYRNAPDKFTLNGYRGKEMISMFIKAGSIPHNVHFSSEWREEMLKQLKGTQKLSR